MAEKCIVCGNDVSIISGKKIIGGTLCKDCFDMFPSVLNVKYLEPNDVVEIIKYEKNLKEQNPVPSSSYGSLHLDEMQGFMMLADKLTSSGDLPDSYDVFNLADVKEIGLYPIKPRAEKQDIVCDVELNVVIDSPRMNFKTTIKTNDVCKFKMVNMSKAEWEEPALLTMFRNMLNQTIKTSVERAVKQQLPDLTKQGIELFQAESALLLKDGYSEEDVLDHKSRLMNSFATDDLIDKEDYVHVIDHYTGIVLNELKKNGGR